MPLPKEGSDAENESEKQINRRDFLKGMGRTALAGFAMTTLGCNMEDGKERKDFNNVEFQNLKEEFIKKGFSNSRVFQEFEARYGKNSFDQFREKYNLSQEEADKRWSRSIIKHRNTFLDRANSWKKVEEVAQKNGIELDSNSDYKMINGQVVSINDQKVKNYPDKGISRGKNSDTSLESMDIDTSVY